MNIKYLFCLLILTGCSQHNPSKMTAHSSELTTQKTSISPPYLAAGDSVAIIAPAGILNGKNAAIDSAKKLLESWGLVPILGTHLFAKNHHFAGSDTQRKEDFQWALNEPSIKAIWCARGGYGSTRIVDELNFETFKKNPKWIIGYSDITAIHNKLNRLGIESIHGMMPVNLEEDFLQIERSVTSLRNSLFGHLTSYNWPHNTDNKPGKVSGELVGGNLTLLSAQLGSSTQLNTTNKILFIEEIGEYKYHIDRMLWSLKRAGYFDQCTGVIVGNISQTKPNLTAWGSSIEQLFLEVFKDYNFPVAFDFPAGHEPENRALIFGRRVTLEVTDSRSEISFQ